MSKKNIKLSGANSRLGPDGSGLPFGPVNADWYDPNEG